MSSKLTKEEKKALKAEKKAKGETVWADFKKFITRGNVLDLSVGVIMGAFTNILLSICTWGVPGGIKGLVTVLPAANSTQQGIEGIGQYFTDLKAATIAYAASQGVTITESSETFVQWQNSLKTLYTLHGTTWTYNLSAVIDWGSFINAVISFLVIALTLFIVVKVFNTLKAQRLAFQEKIKKLERQAIEEEK